MFRCRRVFIRPPALPEPCGALSVPLVCDLGTGSCRVGFAGEEAPRDVFPTILGQLRQDHLLMELDKKTWFLGDEVQTRRQQLSLEYPISRGTVTNWDHLEKIWHHTFYQKLRVAPEQHPLLLAEPPVNATSSKEKMLQVLFETFNVPALYLVNQGVLSLYSSGLIAGTTIQSGEGVTYFVPIVGGCSLHQSTMQMDLAGQDITLYLMQLLSGKGNKFIGTGDREYIRDLKEKCCYVALDADKEMKETAAVQAPKHQLPDGREIELGPERFLCLESLFHTDLVGRNSLGVHTTAFNSITSCSPDLWKTLFHHILLSGGTGSCLGLKPRMQQELSTLVSPMTSVKVSTCPYSVLSSWVGGSILCSLSTFQNMWVTSDQYNDMGPSALSRKSF